MKSKGRKKLKIVIIILSCLVLIGLGLAAYFGYEYYEFMKNQENVNEVYEIYNNEQREDITKTAILDDGTEAIGILDIPSINFKGIVVEGTSDKALSKGIGLFEHSNILDGNVCLAGHNYSNCLKNLKDVKVGDNINYLTYIGNKEYTVIETNIIKETDWSNLKQTKNNRITIITCVKGKKDLRLCVQAIENI